MHNATHVLPRGATPFLRVVEDPESPEVPESLDGVALVTLMCVVRELQGRIVRLEKQVRDINHREAI